MKTAIVGGHGKIALQLSPLLAARGDEVTRFIPNDHAGEVSAAAASPLVADARG